MIYKPKDISVKTQREIDNIQATLETLEANQDYIAMMTDVELETEESEGEE